MLLEPEGPPEIFPKAQPCSPLVIGSDTLHAIVECGSAFFEDISKGNANFSELPHTLNTGGNINISFVLSSKGTLVCNSSSSVLVPNRTSPSLLLIHYSTFHCHFPTYR